VLEILSNEEFPTRMIPLAGNHEQMFLKALRSADDFRTWARNGGGATLRSYGLNAPAFLNDQAVAKLQSELRASMPPHHRSFIEALPACISIGNYFFCHAGVRPKVAIQKQTVADLLCIRDEFLRFEGSFERRVVHGHTPVQQIEFRSNRINIDTGAAWTGRLSGVRLQGGQEIPLEVRST
jgi:serine/threonine protein phosphatase 1